MKTIKAQLRQQAQKIEEDLAGLVVGPPDPIPESVAEHVPEEKQLDKVLDYLADESSEEGDEENVEDAANQEDMRAENGYSAEEDKEMVAVPAENQKLVERVKLLKQYYFFWLWHGGKMKMGKNEKYQK